MNTIIIEKDFSLRLNLEKSVIAHPFLTLQGSFESALQAYQIIFTCKIDLILLNISNSFTSNDIDFSIGLQKKPLIIFIHSENAHPLNTENYTIVDIMPQNIDYQNFSKSIAKAKHYFDTQNTEGGYVFIHTKQGDVRIHMSDILYLKSLQNYVQVVTTKESYMQLITLKELYQQLPQQMFIQIRKSYVVNKYAIEHFTKDSIRINQLEIPIGRSFKESFQKAVSHMASFAKKH